MINTRTLHPVASESSGQLDINAHYGEVKLSITPRHHHPRRSTHRRWRPAALLAALALVSACGSGSHDAGAKPEASQPTSAAPPSSSPPSADPQAAVKAEVLSAYQHFREEQVKAYAKATTDGTDIKKYATAEALGQVTVDLLSLKQAGNVTQGAPTSTPKVTAVDLSGKTAKATITDCLDVTNWKVVNRQSGAPLPAPKGQLKRYVNDATLEKWGTQWLVLTDKAQKRAC